MIFPVLLFDQKKRLSEIECPTIILPVAPPKETAPSYFEKNGILLSSMDEKDVEKVHKLIKTVLLHPVMNQFTIFMLTYRNSSLMQSWR